MSHKSAIKAIIDLLREKIQANKLVVSDINLATEKIAKLGYAYDSMLFPSLPSNTQWAIPPLVRPESLAEALLWKMGKWEIYKSFVAHYDNTTSAPKKTDVVFYAFAKHLQDDRNPIYDQHALRALWAIDAHLSKDQAKICRNLLAKNDGNWKPIASGANTSAGYYLYVERIQQLAKCGISLDALDKLLMPLGQALKSNTENITEFVEITGCAE